MVRDDPPKLSVSPAPTQGQSGLALCRILRAVTQAIVMKLAHGEPMAMLGNYLCLAWVARNASRVARGFVKLDLDWLGERASTRSTNGLNGLSSLNQNMKRRMRRGARQEASSNSFARQALETSQAR